jgi:AraC-like DNA-binding protein
LKRKETRTLTVPARYVAEILAALRNRDTVPVESLLARAGLDLAALEQPRMRLSLQQFSRFYGAVAVALDDELLGLGRHPVRPGTVEIMCRAGLTAATLGEGAAIVARVANAVSQETQIRFTQDKAGCKIVWVEELTHARYRSLFYEINVLTIYAVLSWLAGRGVALVRTDFPFAQPRHLFELRSLLPGELYFDQQNAAIHLAAEIASITIQREARDIGNLLRTAPASFIEGLMLKGKTAMQVRSLIRALLPRLLSLEDAAAQMAISPSTLHRKLKDEGESFQSIKDDLRRDLAVHAMTRTARPIKQIAQDLGFSAQSTFQRAFAHWTGQPPGVYRAQRLKPGSH